MQFKTALIENCKSKMIREQELLMLALEEISESMNSETKSSAGDKHETARARMQFEEGKLTKQLEESKSQWNAFNKIDFTKSSIKVGTGSLVETNNGLFFISASLGKIELKDKVIYAISPASPLANCMKGLATGESFEFNNLKYRISSVN
jgi:hypothetical protein